MDQFGVYNGSVKVAAGHYVSLREPEPSTIDIYSIAVGLGKTCRFNGHIPGWYTVAEHCVLMVKLAKRDGHTDREFLRALLMHDAAEAYIGDITKPVKVELGGIVKTIETRMEWAIGDRFQLDFNKHVDLIKHYDRIMLKSERAFFWPNDQMSWVGLDEIDVREVKFKCWERLKAVSKFLEYAGKLGIE